MSLRLLVSCHRRHRQILMIAPLAVFCSVLAAQGQPVVLNETFNSYANSTALSASWIKAGGSTPGLSSSFTSAPSGNTATLSSQAMTISNDVVYHDLGQTVTKSFSLDFKLLSTTNSRVQMGGLLNSAGTQGYMVYWDSGTATVNNGTGVVSIHKMDFGSAWTDFTLTGSQIGSTSASGHPATGYAVTSTSPSVTYDSTFQGLADFMLTWDDTTGALKVFVDGVQKLSTTDLSFTSFSRVYMRGNSTGYVDDVVLIVPEPSAMALSAALAPLTLARRRRVRIV